jgi:hypothetical protein
MNTPLRIDFALGQLKTPEHLYNLRNTLSIDYYTQFELLQAPVAYGYTFMDIYAQDEQVIKLYNDGKPAEAITVIVNRRANMKNMSIPVNPIGLKVDKRHHAVLQVAALFLIEETEDIRVFKQEVIDAKIEDFLSSGVSYEDLFTLVVKLAPGLLTALEEVSRTISVVEQTAQQVKEQLQQPISETEK